jgi:predicted nucleotidyltransferase
MFGLTLDTCQKSPLKPSEVLAIHRDALRQLLKRYGFNQPRVFGSVLTQTDTEDSDLDLLVEPQRGTTLFTLAGLEADARKLTGVRVSVLTPGFLSPQLRAKVLDQAEPL